MSGEKRPNWFFSKFDQTFLDTVKRDLATIFSVDRGSGVLVNAVEKSEI